VVLYGCETWSLAIWEEHKLTVLENRLLRRIFGPKRHEVKGGSRKQYKEQIHNLYSSSSLLRMTKSKRMALAEHETGME
jgi:hypothetical protein